MKKNERTDEKNIITDTKLINKDNENKEDMNKLLFGNCLLVLTPNNHCIGIKLDYNKPIYFKNDLKRQMWHKEAAKRAIIMKNKIENGLLKVKEIGDDYLDLYPNISQEHLKLLMDDKLNNGRI